MNIQEQIDSGVKLLEGKSVDQEHIDWYKAAIPALLQQVVGKVTTHFPKLLELAGAHEDGSEDNAKLINFSLGCRFDFSDVEIYDVKVKLGYSQRVTDAGAAQGPVHSEPGDLPGLGAEPKNEEDEAPANPEDSPLPETEAPANAGEHSLAGDGY